MISLEYFGNIYQIGTWKHIKSTLGLREILSWDFKKDHIHNGGLIPMESNFYGYHLAY